MTRILIADDHEVVRSGVRAILETHEGWEVVAEAKDGKDAIAKAVETQPDVAIIDYSLPVMKRHRGDAPDQCQTAEDANPDLYDTRPNSAASVRCCGYEALPVHPHYRPSLRIHSCARSQNRRSVRYDGRKREARWIRIAERAHGFQQVGSIQWAIPGKHLDVLVSNHPTRFKRVTLRLVKPSRSTNSSSKYSA